MVKDEIKAELLDMVQKHDYSYMMSDDHRAWERGMLFEKQIEAKIHSLCVVHMENPISLMAECSVVRDEQYTNGLTHKTIYGWFSKYMSK